MFLAECPLQLFQLNGTYYVFLSWFYHFSAPGLQCCLVQCTKKCFIEAWQLTDTFISLDSSACYSYLCIALPTPLPHQLWMVWQREWLKWMRKLWDVKFCFWSTLLPWQHSPVALKSLDLLSCHMFFKGISHPFHLFFFFQWLSCNNISLGSAPGYSSTKDFLQANNLTENKITSAPKGRWKSGMIQKKVVYSPFEYVRQKYMKTKFGTAKFGQNIFSHINWAYKGILVVWVFHWNHRSLANCLKKIHSVIIAHLLNFC